MNYYLLALLVYALFISALSMEWYVYGGIGVRYLLVIRLAGVPLFRQSLRVQTREDQLVIRQKHLLSRKEKPKHLFRVWSDARVLLPFFMQPSVRKTLVRAVRLETLRFTLDIASPDAAGTALAYSAINLLWQTALRIRPGARVNGRISADFHGSRTSFSLQGIVRIRLGRMLVVAVALLKARLGARKGKQAYATPD